MLDNKKVGVKITSLRKNAGYSQEKLADVLSVTPQAVSRWENGHTLPDTSTLPVLAQIFGCTIDDIIMPAYMMDEKIEDNKNSAAEIQAEKIAEYVISKLDKREKKNQTKHEYSLSDETIIESIYKAYGNTEGCTITREKTSKATGKICTPITVTASASEREFKLLEVIYHKRTDEFYRYDFLKDYISDIPRIYHVDHGNKLILIEDISGDYAEGYHFDEPDADGEIIRANLKTMLGAAARWHSTFWENGDAFGKVGLPWRLEAKENLIAHIGAMERGAKKYRKDELAGKIPKLFDETYENRITEKELDYFDLAIQYMKDHYPDVLELRFHTGKNITVIHGDMHPGTMCMSRIEPKVKFRGLQAVRMGLGAEDLAMFIALHVEPEKKSALPLLDHYYQCLTETVHGYSYEMFMDDYKLAIAENLFFPLRLMQSEGIYDFRMRDKALKAFETFVID